MISLKITNKNQYIFLFIIVGIGFFLRIIRLDFQSLWYDELHSIIPTNPANSVASIIEYCKMDQPPAFFLLLHGWFKIFSYNEYIGRLFSVFVGLLGMVSIYFLGREIHSKEAGLCASAITAINWFHIYFSQELRFYTLLFLLTILSYLFFIRSYKKQNLFNFSLYTLFSIMLIYTHYYGMVVLAAQLITFIGLIIFFNQRNIKFISYAILSGILIFTAFIPWLPTILSDNQTASFWIKKPSIFFPIVYLYVYLGKDPYFAIISIILTGLCIKYALKLYKNVPYESISEPGQKNFKLDFYTLSLWLILTYLIPFLYSVIAIPMLHERYTIITLPAYFIIFSIGWTLIKTAKMRLIITGTLIISTFINLLFFNKYYSRINKTQFRELVQDVISQNKDSAILYSDGAWYFNYYFGAMEAGYEVKNPPDNMEPEVANLNAVWVLTSPTLQGVSENNLIYLSTQFIPVKKIEYQGVSAVRYERKL